MVLGVRREASGAGVHSQGSPSLVRLLGHDSGASQADWDTGLSTAAPRGAGRREGAGGGGASVTQEGVVAALLKQPQRLQSRSRGLIPDTGVSLATSECSGQDPVARREPLTGRTRGLSLAWARCSHAVGPQQTFAGLRVTGLPARGARVHDPGAQRCGSGCASPGRCPWVRTAVSP